MTDKPAMLAEILKKRRERIDLLTQPADVKNVDLTWAKFVSAEAGWGEVQRGRVPGDGFMKVGGTSYESGLFGHAVSAFKFDIGGKWTIFKSAYGLQDEHSGSVIFVVRGDGKELFRSQKIADHRLQRLEVSVSGVKRLELIIEDADDGNGHDWGLWIEPTLER
jgi:hypothetical protein